jgi:hypothetical protein
MLGMPAQKRLPFKDHLHFLPKKRNAWWICCVGLSSLFRNSTNPKGDSPNEAANLVGRVRSSDSSMCSWAWNLGASL